MQLEGKVALVTGLPGAQTLQSTTPVIQKLPRKPKRK